MPTTYIFVEKQENYFSVMHSELKVLGNDHNKPHSLMSDPTSTMYFHNMSCDLWNKIFLNQLKV